MVRLYYKTSTCTSGNSISSHWIKSSHEWQDKFMRQKVQRKTPPGVISLNFCHVFTLSVYFLSSWEETNFISWNWPLVESVNFICLLCGRTPLNTSTYVFVFVSVHTLPNLTVLSLSGCSKITDDGIELIAENLRKLRSLDISWCPRVTDAALEYIACDLNNLEELTLDRFAVKH